MVEDIEIRDDSLNDNDKDFERKVRPIEFSDFSGQGKVVENLKVFVQAAKMRKESLDHVLLHGPPGLGKLRYQI